MILNGTIVIEKQNLKNNNKVFYIQKCSEGTELCIGIG